MLAIETHDLTKYYGKNLGIKDLNMRVPQGVLFGFLGANGAGKTTAIRVIMGLLKPTSGSLQILGKAITKKRQYYPDLYRKIGFLPGELRLYEDMTGEDFLNYLGAFYGTIHPPLQSKAIDSLELSKKDLKRSISGYSRGMKQKVGIISSIQHNPHILIMDEPTEGLDPLMQKHFYLLLLELNREGKTIFMSSHNLSEVERICEQVAVIRDGELVAVEDVEDLKDRRLYSLGVVFSTEEEASSFQIPQITIVSQEKEKVLFRWRGEFSTLFSQLSKYSIVDFTCEKASLEEIFLTYYSIGGREDE